MALVDLNMRDAYHLRARRGGTTEQDCLGRAGSVGFSLGYFSLMLRRMEQRLRVSTFLIALSNSAAIVASKIS